MCWTCSAILWRCKTAAGWAPSYWPGPRLSAAPAPTPHCSSCTNSWETQSAPASEEVSVDYIRCSFWLVTYKITHRLPRSAQPSHGPLWHTGHQTHTTDRWWHSDSKQCNVHLHKHKSAWKDNKSGMCMLISAGREIILLPAVPWWQMTDSRSYVVTWEGLSLARKGCMLRPSSGKETWLLILNEYITSCLKRFRWMHRICKKILQENKVKKVLQKWINGICWKNNVKTVPLEA